MTTSEQIKQFLTERKSFLPPRSQIARMAGINYQALQKYTNGEHCRHLTPVQVSKLIPVLEKMGFKLLK